LFEAILLLVYPTRTLKNVVRIAPENVVLVEVKKQYCGIVYQIFFGKF